MIREDYGVTSEDAAKTSAWRVPAFRRLWTAGLFSHLGAEIGEIALPVLTLVTLGATAQELSWVRIAMFAPFLLLTMWIGVLVDRRRRRPLMVVADVGRGVVLAAVAVLAITGALTVPMLVAATAVVGSMTVLYTMAEFSLMPHAVDETRLPDANAKVTATQSAVNVGGSGVGGALVQALTAPVAVAANAVGYLASALLISRTRVAEPQPERTGTTPWQEALAGLRRLGRDRSLRALSAEATIWNLGNEIFTLAVTVVLVGEHGPLVLGIVLMAGGVGAFLGSGISARLTRRYGYGPSLVTALFAGNTAPVAGALLLGTSATWALVALGVAYFVSGFGVGVANSQAVTVRQLLTEPEIRGRVNAAYRFLSWGALAIGAAVAGVLITFAGAAWAGLLGAVLMALATLPVVFSPVRRMRQLSTRSS